LTSEAKFLQLLSIPSPTEKVRILRQCFPEDGDSRRKTTEASLLIEIRMYLNVTKQFLLFYFRFQLDILNFLRGETIDYLSLSSTDIEKLYRDAAFFQVDGLKAPELVFDTAMSTPNISFLNSNRTARNIKDGHCSILSKSGFSSGVHGWKLTTDHFSKKSHWICVGVAHQLSAPEDYKNNCCLSSQNQKFSPTESVEITTASGDWQDGDEITVTVDCELLKLRVGNERTKRYEVWNLPRAIAPWYLYVNMYNTNDRITLQHVQ
jgi:hypothetical protein